MSNTNNASVADAAENLSEASLDLVGETAHWITNNGVDILIGAGVAAVIALVLLGLRAFGHRLIGDNTADQKWRTIFGRVLSKTSLFFIVRSEEHTSELQSLMRISYAVFCLKKKNIKTQHNSLKNRTYT